jgi:cathepsin X
VPKTYYAYNVDEYGHVAGETAMMNELYQRGPIACSMRADDAFDAYNGGIYYDVSGNTSTNHEVTIVGYGE